MKVIMPMAGKGTRLLPLTKRVPKPLVNVAGRPVMDYVMDALQRAGQLDELIIITGHLKEKVEAYVRKNYKIPARFIEQKVLDGTAGAVNLARPYVDGPVIVIFVDTLFDADLSIVKNSQADGIIWTKEVEDYQRFGVVVTDQQGFMTRIVEKPSTPISRRANIGLQYVKDWRTLFDGIEHVLKSPPGKGGEFYLTDAFQYMVDKGKKLYVSEVGGWYDCGKVDTLLETNEHLLKTGRGKKPAKVPAGVKITDPVYIEDGVTLEDATIGPNVAIEAGSKIVGSTVANSILGRGVQLKKATVRGSVIGDKQVIEGKEVKDSVMDAGELAPAR
ncbi:MAG TPA: sugar phosphate nucleotidyltransferase [Gemmatimonadales bacterium]|nr:sugar phosphate nucleotidyltransferase [Gemmatimonadales bacterium]